MNDADDLARRFLALWSEYLAALAADPKGAEPLRRADGFLAGLETYRAHPYRRPRNRIPVVLRQGAVRLLDYGRGVAGPAVLVIPSLINRYYVLDLLPEHSFLRHLAGAGLRPL